ncbi:MAG: FKBP-type peptidyl-prolyl cis-trans isomerase [Chlamydiota bacterium]
MKKKEKRIVYIHPDLGYGKDSKFRPNALISFKVELIQIEPPIVSAKEISQHTR